MKQTYIKLVVVFLIVGFTANAQKYSRTDNSELTKSWKGKKFSSSKSFVENISEVPDFSILSKVFKNQILTDAIEKEEMVTIFAISNEGFSKFSKNQDSIFSTENQHLLTATIKYHIIPGRVDSHSIKKAISKNGSIAYFATLLGEKIGIKEENNQLYLINPNGNTSLISATDFYHKSGFFHIVNGIVYPFKN